MASPDLGPIQSTGPSIGPIEPSSSVISSQTLSGTSFIKATTTKTIGGQGYIEPPHTTRTIGGTAFIKATTAQTISGQGSILIPASASPDIGPIQSSLPDIGPIQSVVPLVFTHQRTLTGQAVIRLVSQQTIIGQAVVVFSYQQTLTGQSFIHNTTDRTLTGQSFIKNTAAQTITGQAELRHAQTISGQAFIFNTTARTLTGQGYIFIPRQVSPDIGPIQSFSFPHGQDIGPIQSLPVFQTLKIISGQAILIGNSVQTITGQAYLIGQQKVLSGTSYVKKLSVHRTLSGQAIVQHVTQKTITGQSYVAPVGTVQTRKTLDGQAFVYNTTQKTITGTAEIFKAGLSATITGQAYIDAPDTIPPTQVLGLTATGTTFSWLPSTDNVAVTGYIVQRCSGGGCTSYTTVATVSGSTLTWTQPTGIPPGVYCYQIIAVDAAGNQATPSAAVCINLNPGTSAYTITGTGYVLSATPTAGVLLAQNPLQVLRAGADIQNSQMVVQVLTQASDAGMVVSQVNLRVAIPFTPAESRSWSGGGSHGHNQ